jgi:hypothetical protein
VKMPVVQVIDVTLVFDRSVPAARTMRMGVLIVRLVVAHLSASLLPKFRSRPLLIRADLKLKTRPQLCKGCQSATDVALRNAYQFYYRLARGL